MNEMNASLQGQTHNSGIVDLYGKVNEVRIKRNLLFSGFHTKKKDAL
jgi:hypothetical protein